MCIRDRSTSKRSGTSLEIHLPQLEAPVCLLQEQLDFRLRLVELGRGGAQQLNALFEQLERRVEANLLSFQGGHDFIEAAKIFFERHEGAGSWLGASNRIRRISARASRKGKHDHLISGPPGLAIMLDFPPVLL